jgi:hypothetical protein
MDNSEVVGFVCGTKGDSVSFFLNKDVSLSFGQIVRIDSRERGVSTQEPSTRKAALPSKPSSNCARPMEESPSVRTRATEVSRLSFF